MAVGTYDANGIYHYGESDNIAPFSTTLNKLADSASSAITSDRSRLATLEAGSLSGLIPVKPTSIVVAGGTAAINTLGVVTFSGATAISLENVFTSNFAKYKILYTNTGGTVNQSSTFLRLRNSSGDATGSVYFQAGNYITHTGIAGNRIYGSNPWWFVYECANAAVNNGDFWIELTNPFEVSKTFFNGQFSAANGSVFIHEQYGGSMDTLASYTGFTLYSPASFSGKLQVFGYND